MATIFDRQPIRQQSTACTGYGTTYTNHRSIHNTVITVVGRERSLEVLHKEGTDGVASYEPVMQSKNTSTCHNETGAQTNTANENTPHATCDVHQNDSLLVNDDANRLG